MAETNSNKTASALGKFFRKLADFFDKPRQHKSPRALFLEVRFVTTGLAGLGVFLLGVALHGWHASGAVFAFALFFSVGFWLIFQALDWPKARRELFYALLLLAAVPIVTERIFALFVFIIASFWLIRHLFRAQEKTSDWLAASMVVLLAFVGFTTFSKFIEWTRERTLASSETLPMDCSFTALQCKAAGSLFELPEFWKKSSAPHIMADLTGFAHFETFSDSATQNQIAFAAFTSHADTVAQSLIQFFQVQKKYLQSKTALQTPILPQLVMKSQDTSLYAFHYLTPDIPTYLGTYSERSTLVLFHTPPSGGGQGSHSTWCFVIDGEKLEAHEFLLYRIVSGFRAIPKAQPLGK